MAVSLCLSLPYNVRDKWVVSHLTSSVVKCCRHALLAGCTVYKSMDIFGYAHTFLLCTFDISLIKTKRNLQAEKEHQKRMDEAAMLETHVTQAIARATSAEERAINCKGDIASALLFHEKPGIISQRLLQNRW